MEADPHYNSWDFGRWSYLARSRYAEQLARWLQLFPPEQFLFLKAEKLFIEPETAFREAYEFLGLPPHRPEQTARLNTADYEGMPLELRARFIDYFRPHNERLYELVGIDFGWEREATPVLA